jgi:hypothetical protein
MLSAEAHLSSDERESRPIIATYARFPQGDELAVTTAVVLAEPVNSWIVGNPEVIQSCHPEISTGKS